MKVRGGSYSILSGILASLATVVGKLSMTESHAVTVCTYSQSFLNSQTDSCTGVSMLK